MEYIIKMVSKNELKTFTTNKKGQIESTNGITKDELKKYIPSMDLGVNVKLKVYFRINEWKEGKKTLVIEEAYNKENKRFASPEMLDVIYTLSFDWKQPVSLCNMFIGTLDEAKESSKRLTSTQLKLVQKDQHKRTRHEFYLPTGEQQTGRMMMAQKEHYEKEMKL